MKISLGMKLQSEPWGGGNQFGLALKRYLQNRGVEISLDLQSPDLDLIVFIDPNPRWGTSTYSHRDILKYLLHNPRCLVVHRINNSSEGRGLKSYNQLRIAADKVADHTVFISKWLYDRYVDAGYASPNYSIILNGGDSDLWQRKRQQPRSDRLRLVTHHWSYNPNKGFDIYQKLDDLLATSSRLQQVTFTYIGQIPPGFYFKASNYLKPLAGLVLASELQKHDVYLTAAQNEAAGMHHIEGALCGLPLLYRESGALPEYCHGFGVSFTLENFEQKLQEMMDTYDNWLVRMKDYPHTAERMSESYYQLFLELIERREEIIKRRRWQRQPIWLIKTLLS